MVAADVVSLKMISLAQLNSLALLKVFVDRPVYV